MNLPEQVARHLAFCGLGRAEEDIYWGRLPDSPDRCIGVFALGGTAEEGERIQVLNRGTGPREAYETARRIGTVLDGFRGFLAGDGPWTLCDAEKWAESLAPDGKKREMYAAEVRLRCCPEE